MSTMVSMAELKAGQKGILASIKGGVGMVRRLNALGIYEGRQITKISAQWMRGPIIVRVGSADIAIGYGMARRIMVTFISEVPS